MNTTEVLPCKNPLIANLLSSNKTTPQMKIVDVAIEFTSRCFQKCRLCYGNFGTNLVEMPFNQILKLEQNLKLAGVKVAHGTGGEILWHRQIEDIFDLFGNDGFHLEIDTNGVLIDENMADLLAKYRVETTIGLESVNRETYKWYRGTDSLDKVMAGIILLKERGLTPMVQTVVANFKGYTGKYSPIENTMELIESVTKLNLPISLIQYHQVGRAVTNNDNVVDLTIEQKFDLVNRINKLQESQRSLVGGDIKFQRFMTNVPLKIDCAGCMGGLIRANVDINGNVFICNWQREQSFGNVFKEDFKVITEKMIGFRKTKLNEVKMCNETECEFKQKGQCYGPCLMAKICE